MAFVKFTMPGGTKAPGGWLVIGLLCHPQLQLDNAVRCESSDLVTKCQPYDDHHTLSSTVSVHGSHVQQEPQVGRTSAWAEVVASGAGRGTVKK